MPLMCRRASAHVDAEKQYLAWADDCNEDRLHTPDTLIACNDLLEGPELGSKFNIPGMLLNWHKWQQHFGDVLSFSSDYQS